MDKMEAAKPLKTKPQKSLLVTSIFYWPHKAMFFFCFFFFFKWLLRWHMEVPRLGVEWEPLKTEPQKSLNGFRAAAASLYHSHSKAGSEPHLRLTP